jgi:SsrA-binding protein
MPRGAVRGPRVAKEKVKPGETLISRNKRASFDYELGEKYEAGLVLIGTEVKMLRAGPADLTDSWVSVHKGEAVLNGVNIPTMQGAAFGHENKRPRRLLLHANEIQNLADAIARDGMTIVATRLYFKEGRVKAEIALARGKKHYDKRETLKTQEADRESRVAIARGRRGE